MPADFLGGNRLLLLQGGGQYFPALIAAIDAALHEVHLETYIFADDASGRAVAAALARAARRGVSVRLVVDGFGAGDFPEVLMPGLMADGVQVLLYRREVGRFRLSRHRLRRLHRKMAMIDARLAFIGGINVIDDFNTPERMAPRFDYAVQVEGPLLRPIQQAMLRLWEIVVWGNLRRRYRVRQRRMPVLAPAGVQEAAFVQRDNFRNRRSIEDAYLEAMQSARNEILIANAYFLPGQRFRMALLAAAARGVRVTVLLQGRVEYRLLHYATQALYGRLLDAGIRVCEYRSSFLHAKVAVIDHGWATVGSSNIDPFSLLLAKEGNIVVRDESFARELRSSLLQAMAEHAVELEPGRWQSMNALARGLRWLCYGLVRLAIGLAGYGGAH